MNTLLSIDWDWITGDCADGGHGCCGWCTPPSRIFKRGLLKNVEAGWISRLEQLYRTKVTLQPLTFSDLWVAECHADILRVANPDMTDRIIHLDSHDDYCKSFALCCGSWRTFLPKGIKVVFPVTKQLERIKFQDVFICQSSPWTPPSMDRFFWNLVAHFSKVMKMEPLFIGHKRTALTQAWKGKPKQKEEANQTIVEV